MSYHRRTLAIVNLSKMYKNYQALVKLNRLKPIIPVIKADAYGHGDMKVFEFFFEKGIKKFAVATLDEVMNLSKSRYFKDARFLVFCPLEAKDIKYLKDLKNIILTVSEIEFIKAIDGILTPLGITTRLCIEIDTGMGRLGIKYRETEKLIEELLKYKHIEITDIMSHFASSDHDRKFSLYQIKIFDQVAEKIKKLFPNAQIHFSNSGGVLNIPEASKYDSARCGLSIYGYYPNMNLRHITEIENSMKLISYIALKKFFKKGESISYNRTFFMKKNGVVGIIPIGYADGLNTLYSNNMEILINGKRFAVIGKVTMDYIMVIIDNSVEVGDEVVIFGKSGDEEIRVEELGRRANLIPYEVTCAISKRVPRIYIEE